jgi:hypothetical protein
MVGPFGLLINTVASPLPAQDNIQHTEETRTPMHRVGFEPNSPVFKRAKTVHTLDRPVAVIGATLLF